MWICEFCSEVYDCLDGIDHNNEGFWCDSCDCWNYYDVIRNQRDHFKLILEEKCQTVPKIPRKVKSLFKKNLSPLRYPGGKSKMIDYLYSYLQQNKCKTLYSAFSGGASFELAMLESNVVEKLVLNDLDYGIFSLWWSIICVPDELIARLQAHTPTHQDYFKAQQYIKKDFQGLDCVEAAWATLLVNRLAYSGISKANPLGGKNGDTIALLARWNPSKLIERIRHISSMADKIEIHCLDACEFIEEVYWDTDSTLFIDPPYVAKGKDLYPLYYTKKDHQHLAFVLDNLYKGMPGADIIVTYDHHEIITNAFEYPDYEILNRTYSI